MDSGPAEACNLLNDGREIDRCLLLRRERAVAGIALSDDVKPHGGLFPEPDRYHRPLEHPAKTVGTFT